MSETWYKYVLQAHNYVEEVASPLDSILSSLLKAFDALDTKVEGQFVAKRDLPADLTSYADDLKNQLESVQEFLWGYSSSPYRSQFVTDHGAMLTAVMNGINELDKLRSELKLAETDFVPKNHFEKKLFSRCLPRLLILLLLSVTRRLLKLLC